MPLLAASDKEITADEWCPDKPVWSFLGIAETKQYQSRFNSTNLINLLGSRGKRSEFNCSALDLLKKKKKKKKKSIIEGKTNICDTYQSVCSTKDYFLSRTMINIVVKSYKVYHGMQIRRVFEDKLNSIRTKFYVNIKDYYFNKRKKNAGKI